MGWKYGEPKNEKEKIEKKISPYMIPYDELTEEVKDYDRDTIKNIIPIIESIDFKVVRTKIRILALKTHEYYIQKVKEEGGIKYTENFHDLPISTQYSNFKQAETIPELLESKNYKIVSKDENGESITELSNGEAEYFAKKLHENWLNYYLNTGWKEGSKKDEKEKINPNIGSWSQLNKKMKKINVKTIKKLPDFLDQINMKIIKDKQFKKKKK